jgi:hypothetical protein
MPIISAPHLKGLRHTSLLYASLLHAKRRPSKRECPVGAEIIGVTAFNLSDFTDFRTSPKMSTQKHFLSFGLY